MVASSILPCENADTASAACPAHPDGFGFDIPHFCCRHLWRRRTLLCEHCVRDRIVFHHVTSEYNSTFVLLKVLVPTPNSCDHREPSTTQNVLFCPHFLASAITSFLFLTFVSWHGRYLFLFFPILYPLQLLHLVIFIACGIGIIFVHKKVVVQWIPLPAMWPSWSLRWVPSKRFLVDSSASTMHVFVVLRIPDVRQVFLFFTPMVLQGIAAGIGTSNFLRACLIVFLELRICSIDEINTSQLPRIVELRFFSIAHFCLSFRCAASDMSYHTSSHK